MLSHRFFKSEQVSDKYIVLLHGFGGNHRIWKHQIPLLTKQYNVLAIDLPSHHEDHKHNLKLSQIEPSLKAVADEILATCDIYDIKSKDTGWMGVSLGTIFVKYIEAYHPEYVTFGVLVGAVATVNTLFTAIVDLFSHIGDKLPFGLVYRVFSYVIMPGADKQESRNIFRKCALALNQHEFKLWMKVFNQAFAFNRRFDDRVHRNNTYVIGDGDIVFGEKAIHEAADCRSKLVLLPHCGHVCNIDRREKFNQVMVTILDSRFRAAVQ